MSVTASVDDLARAYEALRAQAVGESPGITPRGRAILLRGGLVAWMWGLPPSAPARTGRSAREHAPALVPTGVRRELVDVLSAMALGSRRGSCRAS